MTDEDMEMLTDAFLACTLPKERWTHAAHFAAALWLILRRPDIVPERDMPTLIRRYNESVGGVNSDTAGYHETITQASLTMARALLETLPPASSPSTAHAALMASPLGEKDWPFSYWSRDRLMSPQARRLWTEPDLRPLTP